jgi:hypothetical protein
MRIALIGVVEADDGVVALFRTGDQGAVLLAVQRALADAERHAAAFEGRDAAVASFARGEVETLRAALAIAEPTA